MERGLLEAEKKHLLIALKEASKEELQKIESVFELEQAYAAIGFEGKNHITRAEVERLIKARQLLDRSEREQKEVLNHVKAYEFVKKAVEEKQPLTEDFVKDLHQIILEDIMVGGLYRQVNIQLMGSTHQPPDHVKVYDRMKKFFMNLEEFEGDAIERACYVHLSISKIHPFVDGNGRLARLLMNFVLMQNDYLPISISHDQIQAYFHALDTFKEQKDMTPMMELVNGLLIKRYNEVNQLLNK
ncbi:Fic family protein [Paracholeplasma manati]|uniref:Fic family protein n=1 Tax=Paracholeplasma manati TaxID=591373 RepID=A0ABT2Y6K4_9MOLU|nr:Fic family protein [Paracholeplasma manati]MCV2232369.1 Fic family protein [Paracholeplasma manati]MDG0888046.1 Fic family protein [Paracholeplasma manati]